MLDRKLQLPPPAKLFFYKYVSRNAYFRHQSIFNDKFCHQCNRAWKNYKPYFRGGIGKIFHYTEKLFLGGGGDIRTNFILKGLLSYLRCLVIKVHLYQSIPVYFAVEVKTDIQINFSNIKL